jgi:uncharacterized protein (DUF3084 family)
LPSILAQADLSARIEALRQLRRELNEQMQSAQAHKPVLQADMSEGDIELF